MRRFLQYGVENGCLVDSYHGHFACYSHNLMGMDWIYRTNLLEVTQQKILRQHYHLPPRPVITDPTLLLTPPSLRNIENNAANITAASAGGKDVSIVPGAAALADKAFSP